MCFGLYESAGYYPLPARGIYTDVTVNPATATWTATMASVQTLMHRCTLHTPLLLARAGRAPSPWRSWPQVCGRRNPHTHVHAPLPLWSNFGAMELQWKMLVVQAEG